MARQVRAYGTHILDGFMVSEYIEVITELPRNDQGKAYKRRIQAEVAATVAIS